MRTSSKNKTPCTERNHRKGTSIPTALTQESRALEKAPKVEVQVTPWVLGLLSAMLGESCLQSERATYRTMSVCPREFPAFRPGYKHVQNSAD